jgi:hypothetical protein
MPCSDLPAPSACHLCGAFSIGIGVPAGIIAALKKDGQPMWR